MTNQSVPARRVLLMGMMGAGKTTVGRALAERAGWEYVDNDELVRRAVGETTEQLQRREGERSLREAESSALRYALELDPPVVAGVAGGAVTRPDDLRTLVRADALVVYLHASIELLIRRVSGTHRPWLGDDPAGAMRSLYTGREPLYRRAARLVVDVDDRTPEQIADLIIAELRTAG